MDKYIQNVSKKHVCHKSKANYLSLPKEKILMVLERKLNELCNFEEYIKYLQTAKGSFGSMDVRIRNNRPSNCKYLKILSI